MTAVFNIISQGGKVGRLYFELDPAGKLFAASILFVDGDHDHKVSKTLNDIQAQVKTRMDMKFGSVKYSLEPSAPAEREEFEKKFYELMSPQTF